MSKTFCSAAALATVATFVAPTSSAIAQGEVVNAPDPYVHKAIGVEFPAQAGEFQRTRVSEFDAGGSDAGIGYVSTQMAGQITLYLYPVRGASCETEFDGAAGAIEQHPGAKKTKKAPAIKLTQFSGAEQRSARYSIPAGAYGYDHPKLVSDLWLGCIEGGEWLVKYRGSFPASEGKKVNAVVQRMFAAIDWSPLNTQ